MKNCVFCGLPFPTRAARKKHNQTCAKNINREHNQRLSKLATERRKEWEAEHPMRGTMDADLFSDIFEDLPDGAFFAVAEEHGLMPEDFI